MGSWSELDAVYPPGALTPAAALVACLGRLEGAASVYREGPPVGRLAAWHFAPTARSRDNLLCEGVPATAVHVTGNTVIDALLLAREMLPAQPPARWAEALGAALYERLVGATAPIVLVTGHRRESFGPGFVELCTAISDPRPAARASQSYAADGDVTRWSVPWSWPRSRLTSQGAGTYTYCPVREPLHPESSVSPGQRPSPSCSEQ